MDIIYLNILEKFKLMLTGAAAVKSLWVKNYISFLLP
jgi:hypothetical protein